MNNQTYCIVKVTTQMNRQTAVVAAENMNLDQANNYLSGVCATARKLGQVWSMEHDCYAETQLEDNQDMLRNNVQYIIEVQA